MNKFQLHIIPNEQFNEVKPHCHNEWSRTVLLMGLTLFLILSLNSSAQKIDAFARVSVSPREGVVRQPYKVTISVYSSTWFAKPLQFANLRIDNAFIIPFTRTVSSINYINKKKYATLSFYYLVFPYNTGNLQVPELEISASIPPEGGYKGEDYTILTKAQNINVKPIPAATNEDVWMVAKNITFKEEWSKPLAGLKVGDVIEREISISASGTLPTLIQPLEIEKPEFVSTYPQEPELKDRRNDKDVNGVRTERYSYLFEEEGEITLPAQELLWWNPDTKRVYKRTIPEQKLSIAANPDLLLMQSLKDSLMAISAPVNVEVEDKNVPWFKLAIFLVLIILTIYYCWKVIVLLLQHSKEKRAVYLQSEAYYFKKVESTLKANHTKEFINALYLWFDKSRDPQKSAAIYDYLNQEQKDSFENLLYSEDTSISKTQQQQLITIIHSVRKQLVSSPLKNASTTGINPK